MNQACEGRGIDVLARPTHGSSSWSIETGLGACCLTELGDETLVN